ncbi:MAG: hypothetical protein Q7U57_20395 [Methylovulum sp.]|nr:hypothetical protein [Methylovulum sp.]
MTEVLFILTTIFVAYVVYVIVNEQKSVAKPVAPEEPAKVQLVTEQVRPVITTKPIAPKKKPPVAVKKTVAAPAMPIAAKGSIRNPESGEVATVTNNYRFTKRWIKEALVTEGLLDKIYKNNELDATTEGLIKAALLQLEAIDKYRA